MVDGLIGDEVVAFSDDDVKSIQGEDCQNVGNQSVQVPHQENSFSDWSSFLTPSLLDIAMMELCMRF